jgi:hypothetical protein
MNDQKCEWSSPVCCFLVSRAGQTRRKLLPVGRRLPATRSRSAPVAAHSWSRVPPPVRCREIFLPAELWTSEPEVLTAEPWWLHPRQPLPRILVRESAVRFF